MAAGNKAVYVELPATSREHDLPGPDVSNGTANEFHHIARPKHRQHALAMHLHAQTSKAAQNIGRQGGTLRLNGFVCFSHGS
jgi:hypothetical protein